MNIFEWLSKLIAIDTTSRLSNMPLVAILEDFFAKQRIQARLTHSPIEKKANLFATLPAVDGSIHGGLVLSGHTDVVPVDGQKWDTNPFEAVKIKDRIYGRGACDMKGFLAVCLALAPHFQKLKLKKPLHMAFSYDEENGCHGAPILIADLEKAGFKPGACIIGEPTDMLPVVGHKGYNVFRCRAHGHAVHSSLTSQGCNAIDYAAKLICHIRSIAERMRKEGPFDDHYDLPYSTISTNMVQGGIALNTLPALCEFFFDVRQLPHVEVSSIAKKWETYVKRDMAVQMQREKFLCAIEIDQLIAIPSFAASEEASISRLTRKITGDHEIHKVAFGTEAGLFQKAHIPTILCGPGEIKHAHQANEFVTTEQLAKCEQFLRKAVEDFCC